MSAPAQPLRGEIWDIDLAPTRGHEQTGIRPALVISSDAYNKSPSGLVVALPITKMVRNVPWHLPLAKGRAGLVYDSSLLCDHVRSISVERLVKCRGTVDDAVLENVERLMKYLLEIP